MGPDSWLTAIIVCACIVNAEFGCVSSSRCSHNVQYEVEQRRLGLENSYRGVGLLRIRGGRQKREARLDEENERVAAELMSRIGEQKGTEMQEGAEKSTVHDEEDREVQDSKRRSKVYVRSLHWNLVHRTALALVLPDEAWGQIQPFRVDHDKEMNAWGMPSMVLSQPCFSAGWLWEAADALESRLRTLAPFRIKLDSFKLVRHAMTTSLWLVPDQASLDALETLYSEILDLFPTLADKALKLVGGRSPHITMGQFDQERRAQEMMESLSTDWKPIEFEVALVSIMSQEAEGCAFSAVREVHLGQREEDALEHGILSEAEANLESGSEGEAVVQEWNSTECRFKPVVDGKLGELNRKYAEREKRERDARNEKMDADARAFLRLPSKSDEECLRVLPDQVKLQIRELLDERGACKLFEFVKRYKSKFQEDLAALGKDVGFSTTGAMFKHGLSDVYLTRRGQDVYVHPKITSELRQKQGKRASLQRQLKAMKGRDKVERATLGASHRRILEAERRVVSKFRKHVTPEDAMAMDELALMNAVDQRDKKRQGFEHGDIETQRFYDELAKANKGEQEMERRGRRKPKSGTKQAHGVPDEDFADDNDSSS